MNHPTHDAAHQTIGKALGRVPSGVFILTAAHRGRAAAMLASWVQQASFEPPAVSIALAKGRPIGELIRASGALTLSVVSNEDKSLMKHYARGTPDENDPFAGVRVYDLGGDSAPALAEALAYLDCRFISACEFGGDHELLVARVVGGAMLREGTAFAHQRGNGFHY